MSTICSCTNPTFGNTGRPTCVIEMAPIAFPIPVPRYQADGVTRNTIDVSSATVGADIQALIAATTAVLERLYPFPYCENVTAPRTDTQYETAPSQRKFKTLDGIRSWLFELWGKNSAHQIWRELEKFGCSDLDFFLADTDGNFWGILDNLTDTDMRGYTMSAETFDVFKEYATDGSTGKLMTSWDVDSVECESNSYAITPGELGYAATTLSGLISGFQTVTPLTNTTVQTVVFEGFGSAGDREDIVSLLVTNFTVENTDVPAGDIALSLTEPTPGTYIITTSAMTVAENHKITCTAPGFDVADGTFVAV